MGKGVKRRDQDKNQFVMKGNQHTHYPHTVKVLFQREPTQPGFVHPSMRTLNIPKLILPTFNTDRVYFTPAFRLPCDHPDLEHYTNKHHTKVQNYQPISAKDIMVPKPKDKRYCHVCEGHFEDYLDHILSERHRKVLKEDKFQHRIQKLCRKLVRRDAQFSYSQVSSSKPTELEEPMELVDSKENNQNSTNQQVQQCQIAS